MGRLQAYEERIGTLLEDGLTGFVLVCLILTLFLHLKVAIWAGIGILTSIFGAFWLMPALDVSLNMLSLFGFLLAMGILVDDAIIIGESIYAKQEAVDAPGCPRRSRGDNFDGRGQEKSGISRSSHLRRARRFPAGCHRCHDRSCAFLPGLFLPGWAGQMMKPICLVMILTLVFSLVEALLILPAHLAALKPVRLLHWWRCERP